MSANGGLGGWVIVGTYPLSHLGPQAPNTVLAGPASGGAAASVTARALVAADLPAGTGTVTSVTLTMPGILFNSTVPGSPITTSGTLAPTLLTQTPNFGLFGPASGATVLSPTFRALVPLDIPAGLAGTGLTSTAGVLSVTTPIPASSAANTVLAAPNGSAGAMTARALVSADLPSQLPASVGVGTAAVGGTALTVNGALMASGNLVATATGSNTTTPRVFGFTALSSGTASQFQFGDNNNALQLCYAGRLQLGGYWGIEIWGNHENPVSYATTGGSTDPSLNIHGTMTAAPVLAITAASGQTAALLDATSPTSTTHYFQVMPTGHLILGGNTPTVSNGTNAASVTFAAGSTDAKGDCVATTTAAPTAATTLINVVFSAAYASAPEVFITPYGPNAASALLYVSARSTTGFTLTSVNAPAASGSVSFGYMVLQ